MLNLTKSFDMNGIKKKKFFKKLKAQGKSEQEVERITNSIIRRFMDRESIYVYKDNYGTKNGSQFARKRDIYREVLLKKL